MQLTSIKAPSLQVAEDFGPAFRSMDAYAVEPLDPSSVSVRFPQGADEHAFTTFVREAVDGVTLVTSADVYNRCMPPLFDVERAVKYLGKAPGVTGVDFVPSGTSPAAGHLQVHTADEQSAALLRAMLRETVELPGDRVTATIAVAPGEG